MTCRELGQSDEHIRKNGYPVEVHKISTDDDYILDVQRIPYGLTNNSRDDALPILILHGLLMSSTPYTYFSNKNCFSAYTLANKGYDVWLGNFRSSFQYSDHIKYSQSQTKFWDFGYS
uniref:Partial AB-hydrolase lipase domain-containing protein n=1 Tax=Strigamia maritima TaxID=126957 RepID=T1ITJ7_STRMM